MSVTTLASTATTSPDVEPIDERGVRFDTQCVLIPEPSPRPRMPRVVTKSYTLPLWKRRATIPDQNSEGIIAGDENHVVLRLPLPSFSKKPQSPSRSADQGVLTPCLVHRSPSNVSSSPGSPQVARRTPRKPSLSPSRSDVVTVPLRPCCTACQAITEAALADGDAWKEHFSRAARRRRSLSVDGGPRTIAVAGSVAAASLGALGHGVPINVDEVDKRRRSSDTGPTGTGQEPVWLHDGDDVLSQSLPLHTCRLDLPPPPSDAPPPSSPNRMIPTTPGIPEEDDEDDEDQLFPLPSPRRTPVSSPGASPSASLSSLTVGQTQNSTNGPTPSNCSGESAGTASGRNQFLTPPTGASSSSLSLSKASDFMTDFDDDPPRAPSPNILASLPSISARPRTRSPSPHIILTSPPISTNSPSNAVPLSWSPSQSKQTKSSPIPIPARSQAPRVVPASPEQFPSSISQPKQSRRPSDLSTSPPLLPSTSPNSSGSPNSKKRHGSFTMGSPRHIIADVLRGVSAMGGNGNGMGVRI